MADLARDERDRAIQVLSIGTVQTVSVGANSTQSAAITGSNVVRLISTTDCHLAVGANVTATANSTFLPANVPEYFKIANVSHEIAVIQNTASGTLFITEML